MHLQVALPLAGTALQNRARPLGLLSAIATARTLLMRQNRQRSRSDRVPLRLRSQILVLETARQPRQQRAVIQSQLLDLLSAEVQARRQLLSRRLLLEAVQAKGKIDLSFRSALEKRKARQVKAYRQLVITRNQAKSFQLHVSIMRQFLAFIYSTVKQVETSLLVSLNRLVINKPRPGCVPMAYDSLLTWKVCSKLIVKTLLSTGLPQVVSTGYDKFANDKLQQA